MQHRSQFAPQVASLRPEGPPPAVSFGFEATVMCLSVIKGDLRSEGAGFWRCDIVQFLPGRRKRKGIVDMKKREAKPH